MAKRNEVILIPTHPKKPVANKAKVVYYVVKPGDNLSTIAQKHKTTVARLLKLNKIPNPNLIYPGDRLRLN
jgi:lysozyme